MDGIDASALVSDAWADGWAAPPSLEVVEWAEQNIRLTVGAEPGPYRSERTPYAAEPMNAMSVLSPTLEIVLMWGAQTSKSTIMNICLGYWVAVEPDNAMLVQPTLDLAKRYSKMRVAPMIRDTPVLAERFAEKRSRDDSNTMLLKEFTGGQLVIAGANAAAGLRSTDIRYLMQDEIDGYPPDVDGEGDPLELAAKRQTTYGLRRKTVKTSTPTDEMTSRIDPAYRAGTQEHYHVPCPECGTYQWLKWANLRWPKDEPEKAAYACEQCGVLIEERHKATMLPRGMWIADNPEAQRVRSFHLSSLYSPLGWASWTQLAREFIAAKLKAEQGDVSELKVFVNTRLAETWKDAGEQTDAKALQRRAEPYPLRVVPDGVGILIASFDVQGNRIEGVVIGWGANDESWIVDHQVLWADPSDLLSGKDPRLDAAVRATYQTAGGKSLSIMASAIDSGGHYTHDVYMFCRTRRHLHVAAVKGSSIGGKPILGKPSAVDVDYRGQKIKEGAQLWPIGTDTAKDLILNRLGVEKPGPGYMHFSVELGDDFYQQLTAEKLVTKYHKGRPRREWVLLKGRRNEVLDLVVYNIAAAIYAGIPRMTADRWEELLRTLRVKPVATIDAAPVAKVTKPDNDWLRGRVGSNWLRR